MAKLTFNKLSDSKKSALVLIKKHPLQFQSDLAYVPAEDFADMLGCKTEEMEKGMSINVKEEFSLVDMIDSETGKPRVSEKGFTFQTLKFS